MSEALDRLRAIIQENAHFERAYNLLYWDMETSMPKKGFQGHSDCIAYLGTEYLKRTTSDELGQLLETLSSPSEFDALDDTWKFIVREMKKNLTEEKNIPQKFYSEYLSAQNEAGVAWQEAKKASDFSIFAPHLQKQIEMTKQLMAYRRPGVDTYEALLNKYEKGMTEADYDKIFGELKAGLIPLIEKILAAPQPDLSMFDKKYDTEPQKAVQKLLLEYIGFDFDKGCTGETEHPFTLNLSSQDVRVSNHFRVDDATDPMFSAIHEGGHAIFEQNVNPKQDHTVAGSCDYMGLHESQSRFFENILGRNINFWTPIYAKIQELEPDFAGITLQDFYRKINHVKNSYIRTAADEVTYCLHVIIRYEIEKEIFRNNTPVEELPALWNRKMQEYLHITPRNDAEGILQDMHWSDGSFGYFPTYLLGTIYDGMFLDAITEDLGNIDDILARGDIRLITKWLNEKIHQYGCLRKPKEVIKAVYGKELTAEPILRYFTEKYTKIYNL